MKKHKKKIARMLMVMCIALAGLVFIPSGIKTVDAAAKVKINKKSVTLTKGKSVTLKIKGTKKKAKWTSSNKKVASVNKKGKVTAKKKGTAKITAKIGKKKYVCKVKVVNSKKPNTEPQTPEVNQPKPEQPITPEPDTPEYGNDGEEWKYTINEGDNTVTIDGYIGKDKNVVIPERIRGIIVTSIGEAAFKNNDNVISVKIPNSVASIGWYAFSGCSNLVRVTIPDSVTFIDSDAFSGCNVIIKGKPNSYAEQYAKENGYVFENLMLGEEPSVEENIKTLVDYIITKGKTTDNGYKYIENTKGNISNSITYLSENNQLSFLSSYVDKNKYSAFARFYYKIPSQTVEKIEVTYVSHTTNIGTFDATASFDILTYNDTTDLKFILESSMWMTITDEKLQEFCNMHTKMAVPNWGILLVEQVGMKLSDIGFRAYDN